MPITLKRAVCPLKRAVCPLKRAVCLVAWRMMPVSLKGACIRHHRKVLTAKLNSGVPRAGIKSFL